MLSTSATDITAERSIALPGGNMSARIPSTVVSIRVIALLAIIITCGVGSAFAAADHPVIAREPAPSPDASAIAVSYMGDIWRVPSEGGRATRLTVHEAYDDLPVWSPDGKTIAFSSDREGADDVYLMDAWGGPVTRLTCHDAWDAVQCWHPDGERVLFVSARDTTENEPYEVPVAGGMPRRLVADDAYNLTVTPDGQWITFVTGSSPWWRMHYSGSASRDIWVRAYEGGPSYRLIDWPMDDDRPMWSGDGRTLYFMSEREDGTPNIWKVQVELPAPGTGEPRLAGEPTQVTFHTEDGVQKARISLDGRLIAYEWNAGIWAVDTSGGKPYEVVIDAPSDDKWNADLRYTLSNDVTQFALSPDEDQLAYIARGELFVCPFDDGDAGPSMRITTTPARERDPAWMPDGETLLFSSDRNGNYDLFAVRSAEDGEPLLAKALKREFTQLTTVPEDDDSPYVSPDGKSIAFLRGPDVLWLMDADGGNQRQLLPDADILHIDWSPDSRWIALSRTNLGHKEDVYVLPADGGEPVNVTLHPNDDFEPRWTDDGKRLSFASRTDDGQYMLKYIWLTREDYWMSDEEREEAAKALKAGDGDDEDKDKDEDAEEPAVEVVIDFDGINERSESVMNMRGDYEFYGQTPDGHYFAFPSGTLGGTDLWIVDWEGTRLRQVTEGGSSPEEIVWSADGKTCYYLSGGGIRSVSIDPDDGDITGRGSVGVSAPMTVDVSEERRQMFNEAWRMLLNGFYDEEFHGVDWEAVHDKYEPWALAAYTEEEFRTVIREMIGELNASHLGIYKWGGGGINTGRLGIRHMEDYGGPGVKVRAVIPNGPADRAGIKPGEFIIAIDGTPVTDGENYFCLLTDTSGKKIIVEVAANASGKNAREVEIRPVGGGTIRNLVYEDRVRTNRRKVDELSGGRIGYLHIRGMGVGNLFQFEEDLFAQGAGKDGLIVDIRGNGGGSVHDEILRFLDRRAYGYTTSRTRPPTRNPLELWGGALVLLIDETCYSDAEIFPMGWKALDLGPVVGVPTYGAVIGTNDLPLIDGTMFRVPGSGWFDLTDRNLENWGIEPDVYVESPPEEASRGHDAQLEAAVATIMKEIAPGE
jgi:tricorn protease